MKCVNPACGTELGPGDLFCGECGTAQPASAAAAPAPAPAAPPPSGGTTQAPSGGPPVQRGSYGAEISRQHPGCLIFVIDQSGSMEDPIGGGTGQPKKQVVADAINRLIYNTVLRCAKEDGVRPYFDVGVWSYGGQSEVKRAFATDLLSIATVADRPIRTETRQRRLPDGAGGVYEEEFQLPVWFDAVANGYTPMQAAFRTVDVPLRDWLSRHANSFPPIVIHLTDGAYTDGTPAPIIWELMGQGTADGNVLVFNCHISKQSGVAVTFPNDAQAAAFEGLARELYDMSSRLPEAMARAGRAKGYEIGPGARGYAFNADLVTMIDFLDIGTRVIQDRVETS